MAKTSNPTPTMTRPQDKPINLGDPKALETDVRECCEGMLLCHRERLKKLAPVLFTELMKTKEALVEAQENFETSQANVGGLREELETMLNHDAVQTKVIEDLQTALAQYTSPVGGPTCVPEDVDEPADKDDDDGTAGKTYPETLPQG